MTALFTFLTTALESSLTQRPLLLSASQLLRTAPLCETVIAHSCLSNISSALEELPPHNRGVAERGTEGARGGKEKKYSSAMRIKQDVYKVKISTKMEKYTEMPSEVLKSR